MRLDDHLLDEDRAGRAVERDAVVGARALAVLELGLGHRSAVVDVPQSGGQELVGLPVGQVA